MLIRARFQELLMTAAPGDRIIYFEGDLLFQRQKGSQLDATATAAWDAHLEGTCILAQRKIGLNTWEYMAIKRRYPTKPIVYTGCYDADHLAGIARKVKLGPVRAKRRVTTPVTQGATP